MKNCMNCSHGKCVGYGIETDRPVFECHREVFKYIGYEVIQDCEYWKATENIRRVFR